MNCSTAKQLLSAFRDHELQPKHEAEVADHVRSCADCARTLAEFDEISRLAIDLRSSPTPSGDWRELKLKLDIEAKLRPTRSSFPTRPSKRVLKLAIAACLMIVVISSGLLVRWIQSGHNGHHHAAVAATFGRYLDEFNQNPDQAQQVLLSNYQGRTVDLEEAALTLRFQPITPGVLLDRFVRDRVYLLKMPCCLCVQTIYKNGAGTCLAMFEHVDDQPAWFGNRPMIHAQCNGVPTSVVQIDDYLAASWMRQGRCVTLVGAQDLEQVVQVMAFLDGQ